MPNMNRDETPPESTGAPRVGLFRSIKTRLIMYFGFMAAAMLVAVELVDMKGMPFTPFRGRETQLRAEAFRSLDLIADIKAERLHRLIDEAIDDAHVGSENDLVRANVAALRAVAREAGVLNGGDEQAWAALRSHQSYAYLTQFAETIRQTYEAYDSVHVADAETGLILVSTDPDDLGTDDSKLPYFTGALRSRDWYVGNVHTSRHTGKPIFHVGHVITDGNNRTIGVLAFEVLADEMFGPMLHIGEGLGRKGEVLLVNQNAEILTSLKHPLPDGSRAEPLVYRITAEPAVFAANGEEGLIEAKDYRGEPVLAAYRHIRVGPGFGWGMVVKRDAAEVFAPVRQSTAYSLYVSLAGIAAVIALTVLIARAFTRPILSLSRASERVAKGDLAARAEVAASDEVGRLAATFNAMVERVEHWHAELEEQVRTRTAELETVNAELTRFTYTVSHDLKGPLTTIKGFLGLLESDAAAGNIEEMKDDMARIASAADKMALLLNELLELAQIGRVINPPQDVPLADLVQEAVEMIGGQIAERGAEVDVAPDLPVVFGDRHRLVEVLGNLIANAVQYMGDQPRPRIEIGGHRNDEETTCYVRDNGIGIDPRYHDKVFGLFEKLDHKSEGTGIGLAIVKRIVEVHGGRIWVESEGVGEGSTFFFTLPQRKE